MTTRKHNDFLDIAVSDDDASASDRGYDSEANADSKGRAVKRRRTTTRASLSGSDEDEDQDQDHKDESDNEDGGALLEVSEEPSKSTEKSAKSLKAKGKLAKLAKPPKKDKSGVIYFSSLPPYLKPFALKGLLEKRGFDGITKVFLAPLLPSAAGHKQRSNKRKLYTEGWVEFKNRKTAKICAETLNATIVGGPKSSWYHDDVWNIKYLRRYTWSDLMEQIQRERAEREARMRIETSRAQKEAKVFIEGVENGRVADGMAKKNEEKMKRRLKDAEAKEGEKEDMQSKKAVSTKRRFHFQQNEVVGGAKDGAVADDAKRVLGKIF
ncbi:Nucleotide-binding alpha-beta plait [Penicillium bovifimosum]|uniref:Pre-rRNA-processing protein ESF2 n=1 Tax=Penicillium bovifimosum TaxID=126998 RepID=A0A9W9GJD4_9EURO|nr:Nucleotide-binding alpha-beta plait [Penicillium bovifimosum]KAJ5121513.1 Nucleotide-binding alpha-beta plait [Penicillium bovifimosum]